MRKIISKHCELVKLCHINRSGPHFFFETHCNTSTSSTVTGWLLFNGFCFNSLHHRLNHLLTEPDTRPTQPTPLWVGWDKYPAKVGEVNRHIARYTSPCP